MNKHFYVELFARLKQESRAAIPVMDPTQGSLQTIQLFWIQLNLKQFTSALYTVLHLVPLRSKRMYWCSDYNRYMKCTCCFLIFVQI